MLYKKTKGSIWKSDRTSMKECSDGCSIQKEALSWEWNDLQQFVVWVEIELSSN